MILVCLAADAAHESLEVSRLLPQYCDLVRLVFGSSALSSTSLGPESKFWITPDQLQRRRRSQGGSSKHGWLKTVCRDTLAMALF